MNSAYSYSINTCPQITVREMLNQKENGVPVTLTSHPGNASLYKTSMWSTGIQETLWDVTCIAADKNNQPAHMLKNGKKILLLKEDLYEKINRVACSDCRYITAYQPTITGERLGRVHVRAMEKCFPPSQTGNLTSQSRLLLTQEKNVKTILEYLATKKPKLHFPRQINSEGIMTPQEHLTKISPCKIVDETLNVLRELEHLLFSDQEIELKGGITYGGPIIQVINALCDYWNGAGNIRYDISGPDMIHYATTREYQISLSTLLDNLHKNFPSLVPKSFVVYMPMGTVFRVGNYKKEPNVPDMEMEGLCNQILSQQQIRRGKAIGKQLSDEDFKNMKNRAVALHATKPFFINPSVDSYHSQHDGDVQVSEEFLNIPLCEVEARLLKLKNVLKV